MNGTLNTTGHINWTSIDPETDAHAARVLDSLKPEDREVIYKIVRRAGIDKAVALLQTMFEADRAATDNFMDCEVKVPKSLHAHPDLITDNHWRHGVTMSILGVLNSFIGVITGERLVVEYHGDYKPFRVAIWRKEEDGKVVYATTKTGGMIVDSNPNDRTHPELRQMFTELENEKAPLIVEMMQRGERYHDAEIKADEMVRNKRRAKHLAEEQAKADLAKKIAFEAAVAPGAPEPMRGIKNEDGRPLDAREEERDRVWKEWKKNQPKTC